MLPPPPRSTLFPYTTLFRSVVLIDQLKSIYIDAELEPVESGAWFAKVARKDYSVGLNLTGNGIDEDRKSTRLNSSHPSISYAVFCLKKKKKRWFVEVGRVGT